MSLKVPQEIIGLLATIEESISSLDEMDFAGKLSAAIMNRNDLSLEERRGAFAEIEALRFQRVRDGEQSAWGIYWSDLSSGVTSDGKAFHSPDILDVDEEIILHWITRAQMAKHPVLTARYADLAWEVGRYLKQRTKNGDTAVGQTVSIDIPFLLVQLAIDAYLEVIENNLYSDEYDAWYMLDRAIGLAISINDVSRTKKAKVALFTLYRQLEKTGVRFMWWRFDDIVWNYTKSLVLDATEQQEVITLLEQTLAISTDISKPERFDPHNATSAADRLARRMTKANEPEKANNAIKLNLRD